MRIRFFAVAGTALAAASLALAPALASAQELPGLSDLAAFRGTAPITGGNLCGSAVCWVGGGGTFNFNSSLCVYASDSDLSEQDVPPNGTCNVTVGGGGFNNIVCGTGEAFGTATITATSGPDTNETTTLHFEIIFVGTVGVVVASGTESDSGNAAAVGVVQIAGTPTPPALGPGLGACVNTFTPTVAAAIFDTGPVAVPSPTMGALAPISNLLGCLTRNPTNPTSCPIP